jgi:N-acylneuraminate cytidylyltransferase
VDRLLQWCVEQLEAEGRSVDVVVLLYPTAPLRTVETITKAVEMVAEGSYDSVLTLYEDDSYLWQREGDTVKPTNYDPAKRGPRQNEDWDQWVENLAVYVTDRDVLMDTGVRVAGKTGYVEMPSWRSVDIDEPEDLHIARLLWNNPPDEATLEEIS